MKTLITIILITISFNSFGKSISCQDSNKVKEFKFNLDDKENVFKTVNGSLYTKIVIKDPSKYSEIEDFVVITDLNTQKTMTYSLVCQDV